MSEGFNEYRQAFWDECVRDLTEQQDLVPPGVQEMLAAAGTGGRDALRALYAYAWLYAPDSDLAEVLSAARRSLSFGPAGVPDALLRAARPSGGGRGWHALLYSPSGTEAVARLEALAESLVAADPTVLPPALLRDAATWSDANPLGGGLHVLLSSDELLDDTSFARAGAALDRLASVAGRLLTSEIFSLRHAYASQRGERAAVEVPMDFRTASLSSAGGVLVGSVSVADLYRFMAGYERRTQSVQLLYEENIRFEKQGSRVNAAILDTLREEPARFGLYNNGITVVTEGLAWDPDAGRATLRSPQVVNGCQTSRTVYRHVREECVYGGKDLSVLDDAFVAVKVVAVPPGTTDEERAARRERVRAITRYANTQNRVRETEFLRHDPRMKELKSFLGRQGTHLELQGGSWDRQDAETESLRPDDLLRTMAAVFLAMPGDAYGRLDRLLPGGSETDPEAAVRRLGGGYFLPSAEGMSCYDYLLSLEPSCVLAALALRRHQAGAYSPESLAACPSLRGSQYLFLYAMGRLLLAGLGDGVPVSPRDLADFVTEPANADTVSLAAGRALAALGSYLDEEEGLFRDEPLFRDKATDRNRFLKAPELGEPAGCPGLHAILASATREAGA